MLRKLNHLEFLRVLIFDLMEWPLDDAGLGNDDDAPASSNTCSASASVTSSTGAYITTSISTYNLSTTKGWETFFENVAPKAITLNRMSSAFCITCNDGKCHPVLPTIHAAAYCQYCKFKRTQMLSNAAKNHNKTMFNNGCAIHRCLYCNVNLSMGCYHGQMSRMFDEWLWIFTSGYYFKYWKVTALFKEGILMILLLFT